MVAEASVSAMGYFMPIFAFLLVFIVIYALLIKTKVLGENQPVMLFISFIFALLGFLPGKEPFAFLGKGNWFSWVILGVIVAFFVISSAYVFNWAVNWGMVQDWFDTGWFGFILLLLIAAIVSWKIKK